MSVLTIRVPAHTATPAPTPWIDFGRNPLWRSRMYKAQQEAIIADLRASHAEMAARLTRLESQLG